MNLIERYKESGWHLFHQELRRGWKLQNTWGKVVDVFLFIVGLLLALIDGWMGVGYFIMVLLVLGQGWVINCLNNDLRNSHGAFLRVIEILHEERKAAKAAEDTGDDDSRTRH